MGGSTNDISDVERDSDDQAHFANHTVRTLTWEGVTVSFGHRFFSDLKSKLIISGVDGLAIAGDSIDLIRMRITNRSIRRSGSHHGTFW